MRGRGAIVKDIRSLYINLTPFRAFPTSNKVPLSLDLFAVLFALNRLEISILQFTLLYSIHQLNISLIPARPSAFYELLAKSQVATHFKDLRKRGLIEQIPFNPMLTHTVKKPSKCYQLTEQGKKIIASYTYLVKDTQKQAKNARLKYIDGN
jgi:DNA-binding MarR family transcriptional regulator